MDEGIRHHVESIEAKLDDIRRNTRTTWWELLLAGLLRGVGIVIGGALAVTLAGWGLKALGFIPGAEDIAEYISQVIADVATHQ